MTTEIRAGWEIVRLASETAAVDIVPAKGADIIGVTWRPLECNVLWESPWGLRPSSPSGPVSDSAAAWLAAYPGGWQTLFPNGGPAVTEHGAEWGFHGEAALCAWSCEVVEERADGGAARFETSLASAPFTLSRTVALSGSTLEVTETAHNGGAVAVDAMWVHHPAFGAPLLSGACRLETAAATFVADDERDVANGDLAPGGSARWPMATGRAGNPVDLRRVPPPGDPCDRFGYLTEFERGWASLTNPDVGLAVELEWGLDVMPHAWLWLEANATTDFPWFGRAYVLAIEPASSWPGQGLHAVRHKTGTQLSFEPGQSRTARTTLTLRPAP